jgi:uncharacterized protein YjbJ (UPF0337 family)
MGALMNKIKGKFMKAEGKATNDPIRKAEGSAVEGVGKVQGKLGKASRKVNAGVRKMKRKGTAARRTP